MKKIITSLLLIALVLGTFASCAVAPANEEVNLDMNAYPADNSVNKTVAVSQDASHLFVVSDDGYERLPNDYSWFCTDESSDGTILSTRKGPEEGPLVISTAAQFMAFGQLRAWNFNFEGYTVELASDIVLNELNEGVTKASSAADLATAEKWYQFNSANEFKGTFDGKGYTVSGWYLNPTTNNRSLFGTLNGATIQNLNMVNTVLDGYCESDEKTKNVSVIAYQATGSATISNVTIDYVCANANANHGSIFSLIDAPDGDVVIEGCTVSGTVNNTTATQGGFVARIQNAKSVRFENCTSAVNLTAGGDTVGGFVGIFGNTSATATITTPVTFKNCTNSGNVESTYTKKDVTHCGGFIGLVNGKSGAAVKATLTFEGCTNSGTVKIQKNRVGGFIGGNFNEGTTTFKNCHSTGAVSGAAVVSGYIGYSASANGAAVLKNSPASLSISNSDCTATITSTGNWTGGFAGYVERTHLKINLTNCKFGGKLTAGGRSAAGLIGHVTNSAQPITFTGCELTSDATISMNLGYTSNCYGGGMMAISSGPITATNCTLRGTVSIKDKGATSLNPTFGGVIGDARANCTVTNLLLDGFTINSTHDSAAQALVEKFVCGQISAGKTLAVSGVKYSCHYDQTIIDKITDEVSDATVEYFDLCVKGYQVRNNGDGTYDFRYIATVDGRRTQPYAGFIVSLKAVEINNGVAEDYHETVRPAYVSAMYRSVTGGGQVYSATDFGTDYLITFTLSGVPASFVTNTDVGPALDSRYVNLSLTPFAAEDGADDDVVFTYGEAKAVVKGNITKPTVTNVVALADGEFTPNINETGINDQSIFLNPADAAANAMMTVQTENHLYYFGRGNNAYLFDQTNSANGVVKLHYGSKGDASQVYHYYLDADAVGKSADAHGYTCTKYSQYLRFTFTVPTTGTYNLCLNLRFKNEVARYALFQFDNAPMKDWTRLNCLISDYTELQNVTLESLCDATQGTYAYGFASFELTAGEHTLTIRMPDDQGASLHYRGIYLTPAA